VKPPVSQTRSEDPLVIWLSGEPWDQPGGSHRDMATAMSEHARILWVDPPSSLVSRGRAHGTLTPTLTQLTARITRLNPVVLPAFTRVGVRATTPFLVRAQVRWALRIMRSRPSAAVMLYLGGLLGGWGTDVTNVMYGTDNYVAGARLMGMSVGYMRRQERQALAHADKVIVVSSELASRWSSMGAKPVVIPNGCWPLAEVTNPPQSDHLNLSHPVVGLVGRLSDRIDIGVLEAIVEAGQSLLIVGPVDLRWEPERFRRLVSRPEVHYAGSVPQADVPRYLAMADVGLTPYRDTPFNRASFPLKTLEYMSAGLPVVVGDLPESRWLRRDLEETLPLDQADQVLVLAADRQDYVQAIRGLNVGGADAVARRVAFAQRHSWPGRAERFAAEMGLSAVRDPESATGKSLANFDEGRHSPRSR